MSHISPTTPATFYDANDELVSIPVITLAAYVIALKGIVETGFDVTGQDVEEKARELLSTPIGYPVEDIYAHLAEVKRNTDIHYGIGDQS